ncbi:calcyphosin-like protein isoform X1 [Oculina patagonica]
MEAVIKKVKEACEKRGTTGPAKLAKTFKVFDDDGSKSLNKEEFVKGMDTYKTGLTQEEAMQLFDHLDKDKTGTINIDEFLILLRAPLSAECLALVEKAFNKLDKTGDGVLKSEDLRKVYKADEGTSFDAYLATFDKSDPNAGPVEVTKDEFIEHYTSQRATMYPSDEYFITMVKKAWCL